MLAPAVVNCCSWMWLIRPWGYKMTTSMLGTFKNPCATALPVSPLVATKMVKRLSLTFRSTRDKNLAPTSLNAWVGP